MCVESKVPGDIVLRQSPVSKMLFCTLVLTSSILRLTATAGLSQDTQRVNVTFSNSIRFLFDTDGNQVDAYGSKINCKGIPRPKL